MSHFIPSHTPNYRISPYEEAYRDDMIFMVLEAKDALGRVPTINPDLLDVRGAYLDRGDPFWLAISDQGRVIGCMGYRFIERTGEVRLHRLYVKASLKRRGIGSALLLTAEEHLQKRGKSAVWVHVGDQAYFESHHFYPKHGYALREACMMVKYFPCRTAEEL